MIDNIDIDEKLWFHMKDYECKERHYIIGYPHTFHGRVMGYCPEQKKSFYFSITEIDSMSIETEYWIKGFLSGNEPDAPVDEDGDTIYEGEEYDFWIKNIELFHKTGYWYWDERFCEVCGRKLFNSWTGLECENCNK
jgi:hypothetical protein